MTELQKLFASFSNEGNIFLNRSNEVIFEIEYKEIDFNFAKITVDESYQYDSPEKAPRRLTKWVNCNHQAYFRYIEEELKLKVLEWLSRSAHKEGNDAVRKWYLDGINKFLGTDFTHQDMELIYCNLGNAINRELTKKFVESNYNMGVLK